MVSTDNGITTGLVSIMAGAPADSKPQSVAHLSHKGDPLSAAHSSSRRVSGAGRASGAEVGEWHSPELKGSMRPGGTALP